MLLLCHLLFNAQPLLPLLHGTLVPVPSLTHSAACSNPHCLSLHEQKLVTSAAKTEQINASEGADRAQKFTRPCWYRWVLLFSAAQEACILSPAQLPLRQKSSVCLLVLLSTSYKEQQFPLPLLVYLPLPPHTVQGRLSTEKGIYLTWILDRRLFKHISRTLPILPTSYFTQQCLKYFTFSLTLLSASVQHRK